MFPWILFSAGILCLLLVGMLIFFKMKSKETRKIDYYNLFIMGIIWVGAGLPLMISANSPFLFLMGVVFMIAGLTHHKEWKKNLEDRKKNYENLSEKDKKVLKWFRWIAILVLLIGVVVLFVFFRKGFF